MTHPRRISRYICILVISLLPAVGHAQKRMKVIEEPDSTAFFNGFAVSVDLVGPLQHLIGDYGQYEAALRINLKDRWFPIIELGFGQGEHDNEVTRIHVKSEAPYGRVGIDFNLMKNKHDSYRLYAGARYAYTSFKSSFSHPGILDPYWGGEVPWGATDVNSYYHWMEAVFGVDATIWGPIHLGWSARYRKRLAYDTGEIGNAWYVPGFGKHGSTRLGGTFNVIIDI